MCRPSKPLARRKHLGRSAITNGKQLHSNARPVDGRSHHARRFRDLVAAYTAEIGGTLTESESGLLRQAAALALRCEQLQAAIVRGEAVDDDLLIRISGTAKRLLGAIASKSADREPGGTMTLPQYAAMKAAERDALQSEFDDDGDT
jgi:hypothetical protein